MVEIETPNFNANSRLVSEVSLSTIAFSLSLFTLHMVFDVHTWPEAGQK